MHRIVTIPGNEDSEEIELIEQPSAPVLFLTSASTDITTLAKCLEKSEYSKWKKNLNALCLAYLNHHSQIDHYLSTTASNSKIIIVRLLGGRGHWSYGIDQLQDWQRQKKVRKLIFISGTIDNQEELHKSSSINRDLNKIIAELLREGGCKNYYTFLDLIDKLISNKAIIIKNIKKNKTDLIVKWDWKNEDKPKVAIILYKSLLNSSDLEYPKKINSILRKHGLSPCSLFVENIREKIIQSKIQNICIKNDVTAIITTTSFSSTKSQDFSAESILWDKLNIPIFQLLSSTNSRKEWSISSLGLNPLDLTLQVVMPEIDGRIITRPCAFKTIDTLNTNLSTNIYKLKPDVRNLSWCIEFIKSWIKLARLENKDKKITIVLANYPIKNGRIANGVGLDTPNSILLLLNWLKQEGYSLGEKELPSNANSLMAQILKTRTNDPESNYKKPLDYIKLDNYENYWRSIPNKARKKIKKHWDDPYKAEDLEKEKGYAIHGITYGNISILLQPSRGYEIEDSSVVHSPDLPPPHRYIAQYLWMYKKFNSNAVIHFGKHGTLEWLPGKGIGLSNSCFPHLVLPPIPNIYPFIVNDPGEGSQAKRRSQAVIIDHLTPPLGRAGLYGELLEIENLIDEYYECSLLSSDRKELVKDKLMSKIKNQSLTDIKFDSNYNDDDNTVNLINSVDTYLCEIKESQIRLGLHIYGKLAEKNNLLQLILSIARAPTKFGNGITQEIASLLSLDIDPWSDNLSEKLSSNDYEIIAGYINEKIINKRHLIEYIENQAYYIIEELYNNIYLPSLAKNNISKINHKLLILLDKVNINKTISYIQNIIIPKVVSSPNLEKQALISALEGKRVSSGPSGAPTRGKIEVLPTGRNFFSIDIRSLPTESSWDLGKRSAKRILDLYLMDNGEDLKHLAISIWATSTMRNGGEEVSQILALMGLQPIWDGPSRRIIDLEIIPLNILNRPRVDITIRISGLFRDAFPQLIKLIYKGQSILANINEPYDMNPYALLKKENKPISKIFGSAPGAYGAGLQELISYGKWEEKSDLVDSYINWSQWSYSGTTCPEKNKGLLIESLKKVQVVLHNQDNREHDLIDSDDYYQFHGGLSAAVEKYNKKPKILIADHSRHSRPVINELEKEIDKIVRSRLLNPKWIDEIKKHGYKGAFEISASLDYLFGYDATTGIVPDWIYSSYLETFIVNTQNKEFFIENNPWVLRDMAERLLEAFNRHIWKNASNKEITYLKEIVQETELLIEKS